ncbi:X-Pro dipeptidyl-peptidase protein [Phyllosticta citriasiana]|uniref:X-Pro dipeptidyl-peptidase protein n=1 Tax=Phyllosticta citriasiana TaxID=595635 RepID=UPI0030FDAD53
MPNQIKDIYRKDETSFPYVYEQNATIKLKSSEGLVRCNVYRPKTSERVPSSSHTDRTAKTFPYKDFHPKSFAEVNPEHRSEHSAGETPDPKFWTSHALRRRTSEALFRRGRRGAAEQPWSSGKPKGLSAIVPWEGMSDYYRDRCRHGGILSNAFIRFWGDLPEEEMAKNRQDQNVDTLNIHFRDDLYYASKEYDMADIQVPLLSVGNWGGILLHLRGNEEVEVQRSFLDAFLKGEDRVGWSKKGAVPPGDVGFNDAAAERTFARRTENEWPIARTQWTNFYLTPDESLTPEAPAEPAAIQETELPSSGAAWRSPLHLLHTAPFTAETDITGNVVAHLNVSMTADPTDPRPPDIDLFLTLRHISPAGNEVFYTGTAGDPVPLTKGWLRVSLRARPTRRTPSTRAHLPWREYTRADARAVIPGEGVASGDTQGSGIFLHDHPEDRSEQKLRGMNHISFGPKYTNYVTLPVIPPK